MDRSSRQKINMETADLNNTIDQADLPGIYRTFCVTTAEYTFFLNSYRSVVQNRSYVRLQKKS